MIPELDNSVLKEELTIRALFGKAINILLPVSFIDASIIRQIPDYQEVYLSRDSDTSIIIEILESLSAEKASEFHFNLIADDNAASSSSIILNRLTDDIVAGLQAIPKFGKELELALVLVGVHKLGPPYNSDIVVSMNVNISKVSGICTTSPVTSLSSDSKVNQLVQDWIFANWAMSLRNLYIDRNLISFFLQIGLNNSVFSQPFQSTSRLKVLISDKVATALLNSLFTLSTLVDKGITLIERLEFHRKKFPQMDAIYLISNDSESVSILCNDLSQSQYGEYFIYILSKLKEHELMRISSEVNKSGALVNSFMENVCSIKIMHSNSFFFQDFDPKSLANLLSSQGEPDKLSCGLGECLASFIVQLFPYHMPNIRYRISKFNATKSIAHSCYSTLKGMINNLTCTSNEPCSLKEIFILDRSYDLQTPLLHEFTYEAMLRDISTSTHCEQSKMIQKELYLLDNTKLSKESQAFWSLLRNVHLADSIPTLIKYSESFLASNSAAGFSALASQDKSKSISLSKMKTIIAAIPELDEFKKHFSLHLQLLQSCIDYFNEIKLESIAVAEQDLACGYYDTDGASGGSEPRFNPLSIVSPLLADKIIPNDCKARLLILFLALQSATQSPISKDELKALCKSANLTHSDSIMGFYSAFIASESNPASTSTSKNEQIVKLLPTLKKKSSRFKLSSLFKNKSGDDDQPLLEIDHRTSYELSRFIHPIENICRQALRGNFDPKQDILVGSSNTKTASPSLPITKLNVTSTSKSVRHKPSWGMVAPSLESYANATETPLGTAEPKCIIFIVGGMTSAEVRTAHEHGKGHIVLGSNTFITPSGFLSSLAFFANGK